MTIYSLTLPVAVSEERRGHLGEMLGEWALDERLEGILLLGRACGLAYDAPEVDVVVSTGDADGGAGSDFRAGCGATWFRVRVCSQKKFLGDLTDGLLTPHKLALREGFLSLDRRGRLADVLRALEPMYKRDLPRARLAAAAEAVAALRGAEVAVSDAGACDAAGALAALAAKLTELELLNEGIWSPLFYGRATGRGGNARRVCASLYREGDYPDNLGRIAAEAAVLFKRYLPAAATPVFDLLIKRGGSALAATVIDELTLADVPGVDLLLAALVEYGLVKVGREERPVPGLSGLTYSEPVLTLP
jgi:hypothetical protein